MAEKEGKILPILIGVGVLAGAGIALYYFLKKKIKISITANPVSGNAPLTVNFTATAEGGAEPYSYAWNFGDGHTSLLQNPVNVYQIAGDYIAYVTVTDAKGKTANKSIMITVGVLQDVGGIIGVVTNSVTGARIAGVNVNVSEIGMSTLTDSTGNYSIQNIPVGTYNIAYTKTGYNYEMIQVEIIKGSSAQRNIALVPIGGVSATIQAFNLIQ